ncbi:RNA-directed DNA polymerase, eukaryota [Tanacetum coccineum]
MPVQRSNEDQAVRISKSIFVTNFPDNLGSKELWKVCEGYGKVIDIFIPNRRSKAGLSTPLIASLLLYLLTGVGFGDSVLLERDSLVRDASTLYASPGFPLKLCDVTLNVGEICEDGPTMKKTCWKGTRLLGRIPQPPKMSKLDRFLVTAYDVGSGGNNHLGILQAFGFGSELVLVDPWLLYLLHGLPYWLMVVPTYRVPFFVCGLETRRRIRIGVGCFDNSFSLSCVTVGECMSLKSAWG